ncbi:glycosyltransferase family 25 protein [Enterovibrio sp. 27052020O]|uniref:glycosyltransferase family 25 protein n=1 Tax=Enterovibrio sp. 27052020O TaxID=3241166 RepID=UPI00388D7470
MSNVFVVSLKRCTDRREKIAKEMAEKQIAFSFFDAVDGHESTPTLAEDYDYRKRLWLTSGKMPSKGELGCYASHYQLWLKCIELNQPIVVCEDDIELHHKAAEIIKVALEDVNRFGFLRLEAIESGGEFTEVERNGEYQINLMKDNYGGTRAYAISPSAAVRLVKHRWCLPVDCFIGLSYLHGVHSYQLTPCLVATHFDDASTIQLIDGAKTPLYRKLTRELYTAYKKAMIDIVYRKKQRALKK